jgi:putative flippase GtrA
LISILQLATGQPYLANILGYSIGCIFAYFVHTRYTFRAKVRIHSFIIYIWITASGVALNLIVLNIALRILPAILSQALAVISYSFYSYFLQSWLSFGEKDQITIKNKPL